MAQPIINAVTKQITTPEGGKTWLNVTFVDGVNGKPNATQDYEVESIDPTEIERVLNIANAEFESREEGKNTVNEIPLGEVAMSVEVVQGGKVIE
jgi:hypothetical protein